MWIKKTLSKIISLRNTLDYPLRRFFRWRRSGLHFANQSKEGLFDGLTPDDQAVATSKAGRFMETYHLQKFYSQSRTGNYRINLYYIDMLEHSFEQCDCRLGSTLDIADIGPSHWFYVQGLYAFFKWWRCPPGRELYLTGYELDPYRVYADWYSRCDHAHAHMRDLEHTAYKDRAFSTLPGGFDIITLFFPFVLLEEHLKWGLPGRMYAPLDLLKSSWDSLKPGGVLFIANQGAEEKDKQKSLLSQVGIDVCLSFQFSSPFWQYSADHYIHLAVRA